MTPPPIQILDEIDLRLRNMLVASGYSQDVQTDLILRSKQNPFESSIKNGAPLNILGAVNYFGNNDLAESDGKHYAGIAREMSVNIDYYGELGGLASDTLAYRLAWDVWIAMYRAPGLPAVTDAVSAALGGLVSNLTMVSAAPLTIGQQSPFGGVSVELSVSYSVRASAPFTIEN